MITGIDELQTLASEALGGPLHPLITQIPQSQVDQFAAVVRSDDV